MNQVDAHPEHLGKIPSCSGAKGPNRFDKKGESCNALFGHTGIDKSDIPVSRFGAIFNTDYPSEISVQTTQGSPSGIAARCATPPIALKA